MPTARMFNQYAPFANDVPTANIACLSFDKLLSNDAAESEKLFDACKTFGFFHLNLEGHSESERLLKDAEAMFELNRQVHGIELDEKMRYAYSPPHQLFGFKHSGRNKVESGDPDRYEAWTLSQDDILGIESENHSPPTHHPDLISASIPLLTSFLHRAHALVRLILSHLDAHLHLPQDTLASLQALDKPSGTSLRLLRYLPQPAKDRRTSLVGHTDIGTVTVLFNLLGGLQVLPPGCDYAETSWLYVKPEPGCALINMGDAMVEWSGGLLRSDLHRVLYAPGKQAESTRYSIAYLVRPQRDILMEPLRLGDVIPVEEEGGPQKKPLTALEWERRKSEAIISGRDVARSKGGKVEERHFDVVAKATA